MCLRRFMTYSWDRTFKKVAISHMLRTAQYFHPQLHKSQITGLQYARSSQPVAVPSFFPVLEPNPLGIVNPAPPCILADANRVVVGGKANRKKPRLLYSNPPAEMGANFGIFYKPNLFLKWVFDNYVTKNSKIRNGALCWPTPTKLQHTKVSVRLFFCFVLAALGRSDPQRYPTPNRQPHF